MEKVRALHAITETVDILKMLEELLSLPPERMTSTLAGMRLTIRSAREKLSVSHETLGRELLAQVRNANSGTDVNGTTSNVAPAASGAASVAGEESLIMRRRDLRSALERSVDRPGN